VDLRLERLTKEREADFLALLGRDDHGGHCWCVAWWVPTWDDEEVWTGPESLYLAAGFNEVTRGPLRVVYRLEL
jgi:hypothetical protein